MSLTAVSEKILKRVDSIGQTTLWLEEIDGEFYLHYNDVKKLWPSRRELERVEEEAVIHFIAVTKEALKDVR